VGSRLVRTEGNAVAMHGCLACLLGDVQSEFQLGLCAHGIADTLCLYCCEHVAS
jgi:hypothetical protein